MAALRVPEGDFRDWAEVKDWAVGIADALHASGNDDQANASVVR